MKDHVLNMGSYNLSLKDAENAKGFSSFLRKNGNIFLCINNNGTVGKIKIDANEAKAIGKKLIELANASKILEIYEAEKKLEERETQPSSINGELVEKLLEEIIQEVAEKPNDTL